MTELDLKCNDLDRPSMVCVHVHVHVHTHMRCGKCHVQMRMLDYARLLGTLARHP